MLLGEILLISAELMICLTSFSSYLFDFFDMKTASIGFVAAQLVLYLILMLVGVVASLRKPGKKSSRRTA